MNIKIYIIWAFTCMNRLSKFLNLHPTIQATNGQVMNMNGLLLYTKGYT